MSQRTLGVAKPAAGGLQRLFKGAIAEFVLRPWFDQATLSVLTRWYFPLSRAWAAAVWAGTSTERFFSAIPAGRRSDRLVLPILSRIARRQHALERAETRWEAAFFGPGPEAPEGTAGIEAERVRRAVSLMSQRSVFTPMHMERSFPAVAWDVEARPFVERRHRYRLARPEAAFVPRHEMDAIEASRGFATREGIDGWLRFPCPVSAIGGTAWARVLTPRGPSRQAPMGSLVFAHGIGMEPEYWGPARDPLRSLSEVGVRIVRPEAPWHGRRRKPGFYGGEPILALGVGGLLDFFHAWVLEIGAFVAWARATHPGPVAVGGVSLGALTAVLVATACRAWPAAMRPDALFLVAPSQSMTQVAFEGSLSRRLGVPRALNRAGWTREVTEPWLPLLAPMGEPCVAPENIIVVLGRADDVTLAEGGEALVRDWRVPPHNVFRSEAGHFSTSVGLAHDDTPFARLVGRLRRMA